MKRADLPRHLEPWFTLEHLSGVVRCKKCPSTFVGSQATDLALAKHVSMHAGYRDGDGKAVGGAVSGVE